MKNLLANLHVAIFLVLLLAALIASSGVFAQDDMARGEAMVHAYRCYACHDMTKTLIGPPYEAIAARHGPNKDVMVDVLAKKIILGGGGNWGVVPMVPNEHVPEDDAKTIARWILNLKPGG